MFVVGGESLMDVFVGTGTPTGLLLDARVGGSPFNVAVGLARLGHPVAFLGAVSHDALGQRLVQALQHEGISLQHVQRVAAATTLGLVGLDEHGVAAYTFYGQGGADRQLSAAGLSPLQAGISALHLGSYAMLVEPIATTLRDLVERERARCVVSYDPNLRLAVEPDLTRWREVFGWAVRRCHVVKASSEDLELLYPGVAHEALAADWLRQGALVVVVTSGGRGAQGFTARSQVQVKAPAVVVVDTVGAGDSFQAALLAWCAEHGRLTITDLAALSEVELRAAMEFAASAAALTCSRRGADMPRREDVGD